MLSRVLEKNARTFSRMEPVITECRCIEYNNRPYTLIVSKATQEEARRYFLVDWANVQEKLCMKVNVYK